MTPGGSFLFTRNDVEECIDSRFYGYGVSKNALIFGTSGLQEYLDKNNTSEWPSEGRFAGIFSKEDLQMIKTEIESEGTLSHGYRKLMHFVFVDLILKTIL